ncbi:MAG: hypothetical protein PHI93_03820 [Kiritimatiellae bacterium]|nr:hypothetical protein [Kiritimatiellia bacterium]
MTAPPSPAPAAAEPLRLEFADGLVVCHIFGANGPIPELVPDTLAIAMRTVMKELGPPPAPATLSIHLQPPTPFYKRAKALFHAQALAAQEHDDIRLHPGQDPLKLAFRLGHELSHWITYKQHPARPPLWLDEGLANIMGAAAAEAAARPLKQTVERPLPDKLPGHLYSLEALLHLDAYPRKPAQVGAFYWQAEALVGALRQKLGREAFNDYLAALSVPQPPLWEAPLRERWYFNDADFRWLAEHIRPANRQPSTPPL